MSVYRRVPKLWRWAMAGTLIAGLISQGTGLLNKLSYGDDISAMFGVGATYASGRWMLGLLKDAYTLLFGGTPVSLPLFNGLAALLLLGLSACLMVSLLQLRRPWCAALAGATMVTFPGITGLFGYMFTLPYYMAGLLMASGGCLLICRGRHWYSRIIGILLITCATGVYQAYYPVAVTGALLYTMQQVSEEPGRPRDLLLRLAWLLAALATAMVLYFLLNRLFLTLQQEELNTYMGINEMGKASLSVYLDRAGSAYRIFFNPDPEAFYGAFSLHIKPVYLLLVGLSAALSVRLAVKTFSLGVLRGVLVILLIALLPLGVNLVFVMANPADVHSLMTYGLVLFFLYFIFLTDRLEFQRVQLARGIRVGLAAVLLVLNLFYVQYDQQCYLKATLLQQQAISYCTTLVTRIKSTPGYRDEYPVYTVGTWSADRSIPEIEQLSHIRQLPYQVDLDGYLSSYAWKKYLQYWCGYAPKWKNGTKLGKQEDVKAMPSYPDEGSIAVMDEKVVIKF